MTVIFSKRFQKDYQNCDKQIKKAFQTRLKIFLMDSHNFSLRNHKLNGIWQGYRSINISGNYRAIFRYLDIETVFFVSIGTHSQLYG